MAAPFSKRIVPLCPLSIKRRPLRASPQITTLKCGLDSSINASLNISPLIFLRKRG